MAERRMFAKSIVESGEFLSMNVSARLLYYDLSMMADDDGFVCGSGRALKAVGAKKKDLQLLTEKGFLIKFDTSVYVIRHWKVNNKIRKDLYRPTYYTEEKKLLEEDQRQTYRLRNGGVTVSLHKVSIG